MLLPTHSVTPCPSQRVRFFSSLIHDFSLNLKEKGYAAVKCRRWRLWRSASDGILADINDGGAHFDESDGGSEICSKIFYGEMTAAMAALTKASPKDFMAVRRQWAAVRIQTIFRAFLGGWCDSRGTVEKVRSMLQMKQKGAIKRERAITYAALTQQVSLPGQNL